MMQFGVEHIEDCPYQDMIPIFLISKCPFNTQTQDKLFYPLIDPITVWGVLIIVSCLTRFCKFLVTHTKAKDTKCGLAFTSNASHAVEIIWNIVMFSVFIMGNYYVLE